MKNILLSLLFSAPVVLIAQAFVGNQLIEKIDRGAEGDIRILITLSDQLNIDSIRQSWDQNPIPIDQRPKVLLEALESVSSRSQKKVLDFLDGQTLPYTLERRLKIVNMLSISVPVELILDLAELEEVRSIVLDKSPFQLIEPVAQEPATSRDNNSEPGLTVIGAPQMWALGYTGRGQLAYSVDTGIWPNHPALKKQWKGHRFPLDECWLPWDRLTPGDKSSSHGTHTTGTILGLDSLTNDTIGAAFNAYFIATDPVVSNLADIRPLSDYAYTYEWCLNPDGDINTSSDVPDAINNSWGRQPDEESPYCDEEISQILDILELAGIANLSSAGNEGPAPQTMSVPHNINTNIVNAFTVGSVNGNNPSLPISDFSSRGPSQCGGEGSILIKPEVVAPGQSVRSCVNQDEYDSYSGTSMACPHAVGAFLLLKEAFPYLPGKDLLEAFYFSALDLGEVGEDNTYGNGIINVFAAYNYLINEGYDPVPPNQSPYDLVITEVVAPGEGATCSSTFQPVIVVKNAGTTTISGFQITSGIIGEPQLISDIDDTLLPNEEMEIQLNDYTTDMTGDVEFLFQAVMYEDVDEIDFFNNQIIARFAIKDQVSIPFTDNFEGDGLNTANWHQINPDLTFTWERFETDGLFESDYSMRVNLYDYSPRDSQKDDLVGPRVEMPAAGSTFLAFDLAYQLRVGPSFWHDTLEVFIADECSLNEPQLVYSRAGESLSTYDINTHMFVPDSSNQWRHEIIDISEFNGSDYIIPIFRTTNRKGNNVYIDNVAIYQDFNPLSVEESPKLDVQLFPNPTYEAVNLRIPDVSGTVSVNIFDATGRMVAQHQFTATGDLLKFSVADLHSGLYLVRVNTDEGVAVLRMVRE